MTPSPGASSPQLSPPPPVWERPVPVRAAAAAAALAVLVAVVAGVAGGGPRPGGTTVGQGPAAGQPTDAPPTPNLGFSPGP